MNIKLLSVYRISRKPGLKAKIKINKKVITVHCGKTVQVRDSYAHIWGIEIEDKANGTTSGRVNLTYEKESIVLEI